MRLDFLVGQGLIIISQPLLLPVQLLELELVEALVAAVVAVFCGGLIENVIQDLASLSWRQSVERFGEGVEFMVDHFTELCSHYSNNQSFYFQCLAGYCLYISLKVFHSTLNIRPWIPFVMIFVCRPLPSRSSTLPFSTILRAISRQESWVLDVCLTVLMTLKLLEMVSEQTEEQKPMKALLRSVFPLLSLYQGRLAFKKLYMKNQGQCPTKVATDAAIDPWYRIFIPPVDSFCFITFSPFFPSTCRQVFRVSIGIKNIRNNPAVTDANPVFNPVFQLLVDQLLLRKVKVAQLAAVSPNLESGPWRRAGPTPRQNLLIPPSLYKVLKAYFIGVPNLYWKLTVVLSHIRVTTWMTMAEEPARPPVRAWESACLMGDCC